jgi:S-adenosylmethionine:tRNA ribosyltransferase-isomerase
MDLGELDYNLPLERVAQHPLPERDASRMLLLGRSTGRWEDRQFRELPDLLRGDEIIVINNVRVIPARLFGRRAGIHAQPLGVHNPARSEFLQSEIEVLLLRPLGQDAWEALVRPGRKVPAGERIVFGDGELEARVESRGRHGLRVLRFQSKDGFDQALGRLGHVPLPPYIKRRDEPEDRERYQTVFAKQGNAIAAPTAGLHFTPRILKRIRERGTPIFEITLDVGLGTFEPIRTGRVEDHPIHRETYEIPRATATALGCAKRENRPVLAVGTTVVRALEDAAEKNLGKGAPVAPGKAEASLLIYPGKPFRIVDQLLTNFHLPRSSLLALVAAFAGREKILQAYEHAVNAGYRFYSYGDSMLVR